MDVDLAADRIGEVESLTPELLEQVGQRERGGAAHDSCYLVSQLCCT